MKELISIIIPAYNEEKVIENCITSLKSQTYSPTETIIVDDGSTDKTAQIAQSLRVKVIHQNHLGPGPARNYGASIARGKILVFVDADMTFDKNFIKDLTQPILKGKTLGTFSKNELNSNQSNIWSMLWNLNKGLPPGRLISQDYPSTAPVFRAILKSEFDKVDGFDTTGEYADDWSLSIKLKQKSTVANGAIYYHTNPDTLAEVWRQTVWIGKSHFFTGNIIRKIRSLILYSLPVSLVIGVFKSIVNRQLLFIFFKLIYDLAIFKSALTSFFGGKKSK